MKGFHKLEILPLSEQYLIFELGLGLNYDSRHRKKSMEVLAMEDTRELNDITHVSLVDPSIKQV